VIPNIGPVELIIFLVIVLVIVGPKKLPGVGRSLGQGMREFKDSVTGGKDKDDDPPKIQAQPVQTTPVQTTPAQTTPAPQPVEAERGTAPGSQPARDSA